MQLQAAALTDYTKLPSPRESASIVPSMYVVLIPVVFLLVAVIGAFCIKFFLHDLPECRRYMGCCDSKASTCDTDSLNDRRASTHNTRQSPPLDPRIVDSLLERGLAAKHGGTRPSAPPLQSRSHPSETDSFLVPTVADHCPPDYHYAGRHQHNRNGDRPSPPPSYKSELGTPPPVNQSTSTSDDHQRQFF